MIHPMRRCAAWVKSAVSTLRHLVPTGGLVITAVAISPAMASIQGTQIEIEGPQNSTGWLPFTFSRRSRILLIGEVNGERAVILLDSGAEKSVVDARLATRIKLRPVGSTTFSDRRSVTTAPLVGGVDLSLGSLHIKGLTALVADLAPIGTMTGMDIGVLLGREIFESAVVDIDFPRERIAFSVVQGFSPPGGAPSTALHRSEAGHGRLIEVTLEDRQRVKLDFDLGSANPIILQHPFWSSTGLASERRVSNSLIGGIGGIREAGLISLRSVALAGVRVRNVDALLEAPRGSLEGRLGSGVIGLPILSQFRIITDYTRERLYLVRDASTEVKELSRNRSGLRVLQEGATLRVLLVARHSPAEKNGWQAGDRIVAVNGHPIDDAYWTGDLWRWAEAPAGTRVTLTTGDGSTREIELDDYY